MSFSVLRIGTLKVFAKKSCQNSIKPALKRDKQNTNDQLLLKIITSIDTLSITTMYQTITTNRVIKTFPQILMDPYTSVIKGRDA